MSSVLAAYTRWQVVYQLIVCLDEGNVFVSWDFDRGARRSDERNMLATATCLIRDATLRAMAARVCSWEEAYHSG